MLKLKLQYFGHLMRRVDSLEKTYAGRDWGQEEKGMTEDEMAGWHHWVNGRESGWTPGVGDGQGGLACCNSWVAKSWTRQRNWTQLNCSVKSFDPLQGSVWKKVCKYITTCVEIVSWALWANCPYLGDPMDCSPPGSPIHGILQARILECVARDWILNSRIQLWVFCIAGRFLYHLSPQGNIASIITT